ncbi:MAG: tyrosine-type recombinase/integrase, partial [Cyanobacteria bacterium J06649_11]
MGDPKISTILNRFLERGVAIRNYSPFTVKSYRDSWKLFIQVTKAEFISDLTKKLIEDFMFLGRTQRNWSTVTYHSHFKHYHSFLKWCVKEQYLAENPAADIEKPRIVKQLPRKLTKEAAARLLETSRTLQYHSDFERYRNHAIIACMLLAGLRRKEVIMLKMTDIDLVARELFVQQGKGNKDRVIPICDRLHGILSDYVGFKHQEGRYGTQFFTG